MAKIAKIWSPVTDLFAHYGRVSVDGDSKYPFSDDLMSMELH